MDIEGIAKICYEANRAYCQEIGDDSFVPWEDAPGWQRVKDSIFIAICCATQPLFFELVK